MLETTVSEVLNRYRVVLLDAYGVLVTTSGALPGARELIDELNGRGQTYFVLTNDASRLPETAASFYAKCGLNVPIDRILTAGLAVGPRLSKLNVPRPRCFVFGTLETARYVERAGGLIVPFDPGQEVDAVVVGDDSGFDFIPSMNAALNVLNRQFLARRPPALLVANADFVYPRGSGEFGFTSGAIAHMLQEGLRHIQPGATVEFEILGKPARSFFELALSLARCAPAEAVMLGDQLHTDILGANRTGLTSVLVASGVTQLPLPTGLSQELTPGFIMRSLLV